MIWFLYGTETVQPRVQIDVLRTRFLRAVDAGAICLQLDCAQDVTVRDVREALVGAGLFSRKRFVVVRAPLALPVAVRAEVEDIVTQHNAPDDLIIFWEPGAVAQRDAFAAVLTKCAAQVKRYDAPRTREDFVRWCAWYARQYNVAVTRAAATHLFACVGSDTMRAQQLLLQAQAAGDGQRITRADIAATPPPDADPFAAVGDLFAQRRSQSLRALATQLAAGEDSFKLLGLYAYQIRTLLAVASARTVKDDARAIAATTKLKPFIVTRALRTVRRVPFARLRAAHARITQIDAQVKRGVLTPEAALTTLVLTV